MPKKKRYKLLFCYDCMTDFLAEPKHGKGYYCPHCGDHLNVALLRDLWTDKLVAKKRPWTPCEDTILQVGVEKGYTRRSISEMLEGRTEKAVVRRISQLRKSGVIAAKKPSKNTAEK